MKQYTFFISGRMKCWGTEVVESEVITITLPSDSLLIKATLEAREQFKKETRGDSLGFVSIDKIKLVEVQEVYKDENGELKAVS